MVCGVTSKSPVLHEACSFLGLWGPEGMGVRLPPAAAGNLVRWTPLFCTSHGGHCLSAVVPTQHRELGKGQGQLSFPGAWSLKERQRSALWSLSGEGSTHLPEPQHGASGREVPSPSGTRQRLALAEGPRMASWVQGHSTPRAQMRLERRGAGRQEAWQEVRMVGAGSGHQAEEQPAAHAPCPSVLFYFACSFSPK